MVDLSILILQVAVAGTTLAPLEKPALAGQTQKTLYQLHGCLEGKDAFRGKPVWIAPTDLGGHISNDGSTNPQAVYRLLVRKVGASNQVLMFVDDPQGAGKPFSDGVSACL